MMFIIFRRLIPIKIRLILLRRATWAPWLRCWKKWWFHSEMLGFMVSKWSNNAGFGELISIFPRQIAQRLPEDWFKGKSKPETIDFPIQYGGFRLKFSLKPIHWRYEIWVCLIRVCVQIVIRIGKMRRQTNGFGIPHLSKFENEPK